MAKRPRPREFNAIPDFSDEITLACDPLDPNAATMAWEWWAPLGGRYSVRVITKAWGNAGLMTVPDAYRAKEQVFVLCEAKVLPNPEAPRVRFKWVGYAMKGDFLKRCAPVYDDIARREVMALPAGKLCPIFQLWAAMKGCAKCGKPLNGVSAGHGDLCHLCAAPQE